MEVSKASNGKNITFEEALNKTGFGPYSYTLTALTGLVIISFAFVVYGSSLIIPASACELGTTAAQQGLLAGAPLIGTISGSLIWGYFGDTRGRKNVLLLALVCSGLLYALSSLSVNWIMLMVLQLLASIMAAGLYTLSMTMLSESVPAANKNICLLLVASIFLLAQGIMAVLAIPVIPLTFSYELPALGIYWNSWRTLMLIYTLPSIISAIWLTFMEESPKFVYSKGQEDRAIEILKVIYRKNNRNAKEEYQVFGIERAPDAQEKRPASEQIVPLFKPPLLKSTLIICALFMFQQVGAFVVWLPTVANQFMNILQTGENNQLSLCGILATATDDEPDDDSVPCALNVTAMLIVLGVAALQSFVNFIVSVVVDKTGRRNMVMFVTSTVGVCGIIVPLIPNAVGSGVLYVLFLQGLIMTGLYTAISVSLFPTHLRAMAVSLALTVGRIGTFASVQIMNYLLQNNCQLGFYIFATLFACSAIVASFLPDDRKTSRHPHPVEENMKLNEEQNKKQDYEERTAF